MIDRWGGRKSHSVVWRLRHFFSIGRFSEGVNLVAYMRAEMGLGEAARGLATALEAQAIPFGVQNIEHGNPSRHGDTAWLHKEVVGPVFDITVMTVAPDNLGGVVHSLPRKLFRNRYTIAYWFWELPEIPDAWVPAFRYVNEVWAATRFIQEAFAAKSPVPVFRVPTPVELKMPREVGRAKLGLPERKFLFLHACDTRSHLERKNPLGAVRAFRKAFPSSEGPAALILKINNPDHETDYLRELMAEVEGDSNIVVVKQVMTRMEMNALLSVCDCYVSLHRSEGFGLGPAEAMSLGKPAILTNWSGNVDYMTPDNSAAVNYRLVRLGNDYGPYKADQVWAEPDLDHAAHWMQRLVTESTLAERMGAAARSSIHEMLSPQAVGERINRRLHYIRSTL